MYAHQFVDTLPNICTASFCNFVVNLLKIASVTNKTATDNQTQKSTQNFVFHVFFFHFGMVCVWSQLLFLCFIKRMGKLIIHVPIFQNSFGSASQ